MSTIPLLKEGMVRKGGRNIEPSTDARPAPPPAFHRSVDLSALVPGIYDRDCVITRIDPALREELIQLSAIADGLAVTHGKLVIYLPTCHDSYGEGNA